MRPCKHDVIVQGCRLCYLYQHTAKYRQLWGGNIVQVACTSDGIGDALLGLIPVTGLEGRNPDTMVTYSLLGGSRTGAPWQVQWVKLFIDDGRISITLTPNVKTCYPYDNYNEQNATRLEKPRWQWYCDACDTQPKLPTPRPLDTKVIKWAQRYRDHVILSPFSAWNCRAWMVSHWLYLERLLMEKGFSVILLEGRTHDTNRCKPFKGEILRDESAEKVAALMTVAEGYVGNDSGMTHLAGLLSLPGVVLCAQIKGEKIYGLYTSIKVMNGPLACGGCHWQGRHGWSQHCDSVCANLQAITPENVMLSLEGQMYNAKKRQNLASAHLTTIDVPSSSRSGKVGTELTNLLSSLGVVAAPNCKCKERAAQMDTWGVEGCKSRREEVVRWMKEMYAGVGWLERMRAAGRAVTSGLFTSIDWSDPFGSLVDEAIRRAGEK